MKAVFLDLFGTLVKEEGSQVRLAVQQLYQSGTVEHIDDIGIYWWKIFGGLIHDAYQENFATQESLALISFEKSVAHFNSTANPKDLLDLMVAYWSAPTIYEDSKAFFDACPLPVYIITNSDNAFTDRALKHLGLKPAGVFTSEKAGAYKPRKEIFELALKTTGLKADEVLHVGDSLKGDYYGAQAAGITARWLNRNFANAEVPTGVMAIEGLMEIMDLLS